MLHSEDLPGEGLGWGREAASAFFKYPQFQSYPVKHSGISFITLKTLCATRVVFFRTGYPG